MIIHFDDNVTHYGFELNSLVAWRKTSSGLTLFLQSGHELFITDDETIMMLDQLLSGHYDDYLDNDYAGCRTVNLEVLFEKFMYDYEKIEVE